MEHLLTNLPNGGAVVAIIVVVYFFLARQDVMVKTFTQELNESRKAYLEHLKELTQKPRPR